MKLRVQIEYLNGIGETVESLVTFNASQKENAELPLNFLLEFLTAQNGKLEMKWENEKI